MCHGASSDSMSSIVYIRSILSGCVQALQKAPARSTRCHTQGHPCPTILQIRLYLIHRTLKLCSRDKLDSHLCRLCIASTRIPLLSHWPPALTWTPQLQCLSFAAASVVQGSSRQPIQAGARRGTKTQILGQWT